MKTQPVLILRNQKGQGLVQAMVGAAIMGIIMMSFASMMTAQNKETAAISQKLGATDLQQLMTSVIGTNGGGACTVLFTKRLPNTVIPPVGGVLNLQNLPASSDPNAPDLIARDQSVSTLNPNLIVETIQLRVLKALGNRQFLSAFIVNFNQSKLAKPLKAISVYTVLQTTATGVINNCKPTEDPNAPPGNDAGKPCSMAAAGWGGDNIGVTLYNWDGGKRMCCMIDPSTAGSQYSRGKRSGNGNGTLGFLTCDSF